jgi:lysophospholipase L1-like esterase
MRLTAILAGGAMLAVSALHGAAATSVLFIGNSFTFGAGSAVQFYRAETVTDLNHEGIGGVPALFKSFTTQAGLAYDVSLETHPGVGLDYHLASRRDAIASRPWDVVVMHGFSTLDAAKPGDPATLIATTRQMVDFLREHNPKVEIHLTATWSRPDQTYPPGTPWFGKPIEARAKDVRAGYDKAAAGAPAVKSVIPVGEAFTRAIQAGVADGNPYDGIEPGKLDLWTTDHYHASSYGYYLEALMVFGDVTRRDPRSLGDGECSAFELGIAARQAKALQQVAFDQLASGGAPITSVSQGKTGGPARCSR